MSHSWSQSSVLSDGAGFFYVRNYKAIFFCLHLFGSLGAQAWLRDIFPLSATHGFAGVTELSVTKAITIYTFASKGLFTLVSC